MRINRILYTILLCIMVYGCSGNSVHPASISEGIPPREIVFYAEGVAPNTIGFMDVSGSDVEFRRIESPYGVSNNIRWGFNGLTISGRLLPTSNPETGFPFVIEKTGQLRYCEINTRGDVWALDDRYVIIIMIASSSIVELDMQTCNVESVLFTESEGINRVIVSRDRWLSVETRRGHIIVDPKGETVAIYNDETPIEFSRNSESLLVWNYDDKQLYSYDISTGELSNLMQYEGWTSWSPDNSALIYSDDVGDIFTYCLESNSTNLIHSNGLSPSWRELNND